MEARDKHGRSFLAPVSVETSVLQSHRLDSVPQVNDIQPSLFPTLDAAVQVHIPDSLSAYPSRKGADFCESMKACGGCS